MTTKLSRKLRMLKAAIAIKMQNDQRMREDVFTDYSRVTEEEFALLREYLPEHWEDITDEHRSFI